ncbi:MAG: universal stress protein [Deltaproteobacteria bacterium]|nr:universal stress protein [Deltaproteobacteria bacterium]
MDPAVQQAAAAQRRPTVHAQQLTWVLAWAVVFCDIGTSVYYVPGILYEQVGKYAPLFVATVTIGFILLAFKYVEISWRNPEGGGVVTVASKAFSPRWGALGGMLITVDYFLTSSISATSAFYYVGSVFPYFEEHVVAFSCLGILSLALLNIVGIRESATVALWMAVAALSIDAWVIACTLVHLGPAELGRLVASLRHTEGLSLRGALIGFSGAWLAFSGLESIAQLSPTMRPPLHGNIRTAMFAVIASVALTAPLLTLFAIGLLTPGNGAATERFISELGAVVGGMTTKAAVVLTATTLLIFAANTAIIGGYHVFLALAHQGFLPRPLLTRNRTFGTPHVAIAITTIVPVAVVIATQGRMVLLGDMYAFGLLGAFVLSSVGLDVMRWRLHRRGVSFYLGLLTSLMVLTAWGVNLVAKPLATLFGGSVTLVGMAIALGMREGWLTEALHRVSFIGRLAARAAAEAERRAGEGEIEIVSLAQAKELRPLFPSHTLVAIRGKASTLIREACNRARGRDELAVYCVYVEEVPGLFLTDEPLDPNPDGVASLHHAFEEARKLGIELIPIWAISYNAAEAIARVAEALSVDGVMVGVSRRNALYRLLRGQVVKGLARRLPKNCHLILCN